MIESLHNYRLPTILRGTILDEIIHDRVREVIAAKKKLPAASIEVVLDRAANVRSFREALKKNPPSIIAEIKGASPSAGLIRKDFDPLEIARQYQESGAAALSVITEVKHFQGGLEILARLRWNTMMPLLRKDFIIDPYQIIEARHAGADAVLLIAALHNTASLHALRREAERLGMDALIEIHNESELQQALDCGATLIGVNNRDLRTFEVSLDISLSLAAILPQNVLAVTESGIRTADDVRRLSDVGYRGFLVGEQLMRSPSPGRALAELLSSSKRRIS
jgi:indole-3-glycerol phosphate synthase